MVRKMKKYIKTFPLTEKEIDQMIEDITGMAEDIHQPVPGHLRHHQRRRN